LIEIKLKDYSYGSSLFLLYTFIDMKIQVITLFPEMFGGVFGASMLWKAQDKAIVEL